MFNRPIKSDEVKKGAKSRTLSTNPEEVKNGNTTKKSGNFEVRISDLDKLGAKLDELLNIKTPTILDKIDALKISLNMFLMVARLGEIDQDEESKLHHLRNEGDKTNDLATLQRLQAEAERVSHH